MKKIYFSLLCILFLLPFDVNAYDFKKMNSKGQMLFYRILNDEEVELTYETETGTKGTYYLTPPSGKLIIPTFVDKDGKYYRVSSIGAYAFYNCNQIEGELVLPATIQNIAHFSFSHCEKISRLFLPIHLSSIGCDAFNNCVSLKGTLKLPLSLNYIGNYAFENCHFERLVLFKKQCNKIKGYCFYQCAIGEIIYCGS